MLCVVLTLCYVLCLVCVICFCCYIWPVNIAGEVAGEEGDESEDEYCNDFGEDTCPVSGLLDTVHRAFADHHLLSLAPDHIWIAITQAVAIHMQLPGGGDAFRTATGLPAEKQRLQVWRGPEFSPGNPDNDWGSFIADFGTEIKSKVGLRAW